MYIEATQICVAFFVDISMRKLPLVIQCHTHMPYVLNQGVWPHGETWLAEVVFESYLPLLSMLRRLSYGGIRPALTFDISSILLEQFAHPTFIPMCIDYAKQQINQADLDHHKFVMNVNADCNLPMSVYWKEWYEQQLHFLHNECGGSLIHGFKQSLEDGLIQIIPCALTHAYIPLISSYASISMQIASAISIHTSIFNQSPQSMWIPECGYAPYIQDCEHTFHIEELLRANGISTIILDQQLAMKSMIDTQLPKLPEHLRPLRPVTIGTQDCSTDVGVLIRHHEACQHVWSETHGYPMHESYLDFHKKEFDSSLRYWKVTEQALSAEYKLPYSPMEGKYRSMIDAKHYCEYLEQLALEFISSSPKEDGVLCLAFDTELFGHWWFEGPLFLEELIRLIHQSSVLELQTLSEAMPKIPEVHVAISSGSWGMNGDDSTWKNHKTIECIEKLHDADRLLATQAKNNSGDKVRLLDQAVRELALMQSSDWPFLMTKGQAEDYAAGRFERHEKHFHSLLSTLIAMGDRHILMEEELELLHNIQRKDDILNSIGIRNWIHQSV